MRAEVDVERAVRLQRHLDVAEHELDALAAAILDAAAPARPAATRTISSDSAGHDDLADACDERHAPHDAVGRVGAEQAAAGGGAC